MQKKLRDLAAQPLDDFILIAITDGEFKFIPGRDDMQSDEVHFMLHRAALKLLDAESNYVPDDDPGA